MDTRSGVFKIATVGGIDIKLHWSWFFVLLLVTYFVAAGTFPALIPGEQPLTYWILGFIAAILFFTSVLVHELAQSFMARARGMKVRDITLFIFGGAAALEGEPESAMDEFLIAVVGPLTSIGLAALFFSLAQIVDPPVRRAGAWAAATFQYLAIVNFILALFNMIPGFPLDGGRVLRSIIWGINKNFEAATRIAGVIGQLVAYGFIFLGLYLAFFFGDFNWSALWLAFIGWFLLNAAQQSTAGVAVRQTLRGVKVGQLMQPPPPTISPNMTVAQVLSHYVLPYNLRALPVVQGDNQVSGIVTLSDIKDIPQDQWGIVTVGQVMTGADKLQVTRPQDSLDRAIELLSSGDFDQLPVVDEQGRLAGILTRSHIMRWLQIREELKLDRREA